MAMQSPDKERSKKMTLKEAYEKWGKQKQRQTLYIKTRSAFMQVWRKLDFDTPCKMLTLSVLTEAMKKRGPVFVEDKTRAASVMVHVLNFAHDEAPEECPMPTFDYRAILDGAEAMPLPAEKEQKERKALKLERKEPKLERKVLKSEQNTPDMEQRKQTRVTPKNPYQGERDTLGRSKNRAKRKVAQIDPSTLKVVKVWESMGAAEHGLGIKNISRAIDKKRLAGGFYWCDEKDLSSFEPRESRQGRKGLVPKIPVGETAGTVERPSGDTLGVVEEPSQERHDTVAGEEEQEENNHAPAEEELNEHIERGIDDFIGGFGHGQVQPGKTAVPTTLEYFTDKELIDEIQRRGWRGDVVLTIDNVEIKITL